MKLSVKFSAVVTAITIIVVTGSLWAAYTLISRNLTTQINLRQMSSAQQSRDRIDRFLAERQLALQVFAHSAQLTNYMSKPTPSAGQNIYQTIQTLNAANYWNNIAVLSIDGQLLQTLDGQQNKSGRNILTDNEAITTLYTSAKKGDATYSDAFIVAGTGIRTLAFASPVKDGNKVVGVVIGEVAWSPIEKTLKDVTDSSMSLVRHDGTIIASNRQNVAGEGKLVKNSTLLNIFNTHTSGTLTAQGVASKESSLIAYSRERKSAEYAGNNWYYVAEIPTSVALAPARQFTLQLSIATIVLAITAIVAVISWINRTLVGPIRELSGAVSRIALGDLSQTLSVRSNDEVGTLSRNFNEMTRQLAATHRSLQDASQIAKEKHAQLESSINGLRQGFILTDKKGGIVIANDAAIGVLHEAHGNKKDTKTKEIKLHQFIEVLPKEIDLEAQITHTMESRKLTKFPVLPLGGHFLNLYLSPVVNGEEAIGCVLLLEDVTEERILQRSRDEFFSIASHELRTPLTAIRGNAMLMQQYYPEVFNNHDLSEMISDIHDSSTRLIEIVNDFLDVSRLEQNKMKFEMGAFAIEHVVEKIIYELAGLSRDKKIKLEFEHHTLGELPLVYGDPSRVKQILYNLIGNGMKFTEKGGVTISAQPEGKLLKLFVTDTGPGISEEAQQLLFHKFQQAGQSILTRDNTRGTGLGLYISKLLLEHMGGTVRLEHSEVGKGSTFSFTIPIATETQIKQAQAANSGEAKTVIDKPVDVHAKIMPTGHADDAKDAI